MSRDNEAAFMAWLSRHRPTQFAVLMLQFKEDNPGAASPPPQDAPTEMVLVPREPTKAMLEAARNSRNYLEDDDDEEHLDQNSSDTWAAMINGSRCSLTP